MNKKILMVDEHPDLLRRTRELLGDRFEVFVASDASQALEQCELAGPFAAVITGHELPDMSGIDLLSALGRGWPDTTRILMTENGDLDLAIEAVHRGAIFRFLQKPVEPRALLAAVEAGIAGFRRVEEERLLTEQLQFSRESLLSLTETLEGRLADQLGRMHGMQLLLRELHAARSLEEIARHAAETCSRMFGGRGVRVELEDRSTPENAKLVKHAVGPASEVHFVEPIRADEGELGFVQIDEGAEFGALTGSDRRLVAALASATAICTTNRIQRRARDLAHHATIFALARLAENRDDETGKHLERVSQYCRLIAVALREGGHHVNVIDASYLKDLEMSAPLHDIGKVGVPDSVLLKPGPLDEQEWEIMRRHPTIGAETIKQVIEASGEQSFLRMGHEIAWAHHERWDGSGYPRGLRGDEIPLSARIMALADCYDALTTVRPYKRAWTHEEALAYIFEAKGEHFDPRVVEAFDRCQHEADGIRMRLTERNGKLEQRSVA